jgi:alpha-L-fucosidase
MKAILLAIAPNIKGTIPEIDKQKVREVAKKRSLSVPENPEGVIIYQLN